MLERFVFLFKKERCNFQAHEGNWQAKVECSAMLFRISRRTSGVR